MGAAYLAPSHCSMEIDSLIDFGVLMVQRYPQRRRQRQPSEMQEVSTVLPIGLPLLQIHFHPSKTATEDLDHKLTLIAWI